MSIVKLQSLIYSFNFYMRFMRIDAMYTVIVLVTDRKLYVNIRLASTANDIV